VPLVMLSDGVPGAYVSETAPVPVMLVPLRIAVEVLLLNVCRAERERHRQARHVPGRAAGDDKVGTGQRPIGGQGSTPPAMVVLRCRSSRRSRSGRQPRSW